jgi:hypothetical protein
VPYGYPTNQYVHAHGTLVGSPVAWQSSQAFVSPPVRNGAGDYTLTLAVALDATKCRCAFADRSAVPAAPEFSYVRPSDEQLRVLVSVAGVPTDLTFDVTVFGDLG